MSHNPSTDVNVNAPDSHEVDADIVIAGGGPVGTALAHALAPLAQRGRSIMQIADAAPGATRPQSEDRPIALSWGSRLLLERLGLWNAPAASPIDRIHVSQQHQFGRTIISAGDHDVEALGYVVSYNELCNALPPSSVAAQVQGSLQEWNKEGRIVACRIGTPDGQIRIVRTRLLVLADGGRGRLDEDHVKDYRQSAVTCTINADRQRPGTAWERFTPEGPLALLPFRNRTTQRDQLAVVWSSATTSADKLMALNDAQFLSALQQAFGRRAGTLSNPGPRSAFPLSLRMRRHIADAGVIAIGNAAQTLHPVAGQGLNLGLRDAWELAEILLADKHEPGSAATARQYRERRQADRFAMTRLTDMLVGSFSLQWPGTGVVRGAALAFLDAIPPARRLLSRRMMFGARNFP